MQQECLPFVRLLYLIQARCLTYFQRRIMVKLVGWGHIGIARRLLWLQLSEGGTDTKPAMMEQKRSFREDMMDKALEEQLHTH